jgi:hypothetical protein
MHKLIATGVLGLLFASLSFGKDPAKGVDVAYYNKLRFDYAASKSYSYAWDHDEARESVMMAFKSGDLEKTRQLGDAWLAKAPFDAEIYFVVALCLREKGDLQSYSSYMANHYGLLASITSTGDGLSPKTAFKVISVSEEYFLLRDIGAKVKKQGLIGNCDEMVVELRGIERKFYFDVSISLEAERKEFGLK